MTKKKHSMAKNTLSIFEKEFKKKHIINQTLFDSLV